VKYLLDTDHISILQLRSGSEFQLLSRRIAEHPRGELAFSIASVHEQIMGCHGYINRARHRKEILRDCVMLEHTLQDYSVVQVLPFDSNALDWFDRLSSQRLRVATMDLRIATIALARGLILFTRNVSDFGRIPGLLTENWTN
jgi:tRNA(fMet)-specific endonuclease VapC